MARASEQAAAVITGAIERTMRQGGFIGEIEVSDVRTLKRGYAAKVIATVGGIGVEYRAAIGTGRGGIQIKRVTPAADLQRRAQVMYA